MDIRFETQRELLEHIGRNPEDRSLIQRMMKRGEVYKDEGGYYLVSGAEIKKENKSESNNVSIDDKELRELKRMNEKLMTAYKKLSKEKELYMGMYDHLVYFYNKFLAYKKFVEGKVFGQSEYNKKQGTQDTTETVRESVYERYNFEFGEIEREECDAVEKIMAKRAEELSELPF